MDTANGDEETIPRAIPGVRGLRQGPRWGGGHEQTPDQSSDRRIGGGIQGVAPQMGSPDRGDGGHEVCY